MTAAEPLVCSGCGREHRGAERFCPDCGMPLVFPDAGGGDPELTPVQERARKVKKQYLEGELVVVAWARHQSEAELIQGLLLEEGVPSMMRRTLGFDVPDMLAAGPREILVRAGGAAVAREVLAAVEQTQENGAQPPRDVPRPLHDGRNRAIALMLLVAIIVPLAVFLGLVLTS
ncbi:MAG: zinc ribbon protein [Solirubrobacterales bacterium]|nr:zinc ribbon protein [Solirubrobacterales bacterium]